MRKIYLLLLLCVALLNAAHGQEVIESSADNHDSLEKYSIFGGMGNLDTDHFAGDGGIVGVNLVARDVINAKIAVKTRTPSSLYKALGFYLGYKYTFSFIDTVLSFGAEKINQRDETWANIEQITEPSVDLHIRGIVSKNVAIGIAASANSASKSGNLIIELGRFR
ncbi:MAG: hypothetical protein OEZ47_15940 [Gammaproteobacteria bacterium]|nr:hypothetical protein [Gammaproteobacteria bacterium]